MSQQASEAKDRSQEEAQGLWSQAAGVGQSEGRGCGWQ